MHKKIITIKIKFKRIIGNCTNMFNTTTKHPRRKRLINLFENRRCLKKKGFQILLGIQKVPSGDEDGHISTNYSSDIISNITFSPITFGDVERYFSLYKHILCHRRTHMTIKYGTIYCDKLFQA